MKHLLSFVSLFLLLSCQQEEVPALKGNQLAYHFTFNGKVKNPDVGVLKQYLPSLPGDYYSVIEYGGFSGGATSLVYIVEFEKYPDLRQIENDAKKNLELLKEKFGVDHRMILGSSSGLHDEVR